MASGRTHDSFCYVAAGVACAGASLIGWPAVLIGAAGFGGWSGLYLSPDLDLVSHPYNRWKELGLEFVWRPYKNAIKHRSWLSHLPVLSTLLRLAWLALRLGSVLILMTAALLAGISIVFDGAYDPYARAVYQALDVDWVLLSDVLVAYALGLSIADTFHWLLDGCPVNF